MGERTAIEWCDHTFQPGWVGCAKVSAGCDHCYAEVGTTARIARGRGLELWGQDAARQPLSESYWQNPARWFRDAVGSGVRRRVFCGSMADVFEDRPDLDAARNRLWKLIEGTIAGGASPWVLGGGGDATVRWLLGDEGPVRGGGLDWLLLTKRPQSIMRLIPERWRSGMPPNVWIGTSVENQEAADERVPHLLRVPARVRFLSLEPLLERVNVRWVPGAGGYHHPLSGIWLPDGCGAVQRAYARTNDPRVHWFILGGESGPRARPCDLAWIRDLRDQGRAAGVAVFVKQLGAYARGERPEDQPIRHNHGACVWDSRKLILTHPKGGDPSEWPEDLRVRELPEAR